MRSALIVAALLIVAATAMTKDEISRRLRELEAEKARLIQEENEVLRKSVNNARATLEIQQRAGKMQELKKLRQQDVAVYTVQQESSKIAGLRNRIYEERDRCESENAVARVFEQLEKHKAVAQDTFRNHYDNALVGRENWSRRVKQTTDKWHETRREVHASQELLNKLEEAARVAGNQATASLRQRLAARRQETQRLRKLQEDWLASYNDAKKNYDFWANEADVLRRKGNF